MESAADLTPSVTLKPATRRGGRRVAAPVAAPSTGVVLIDNTSTAASAPVADVPKVKAAKKPRANGEIIPTARVRRVFATLTLNSACLEALAPLEAKLRELKVAEVALAAGVLSHKAEDGTTTDVPLTDVERAAFAASVATLGPQKADLEAKRKALQHAKSRFSPRASQVLGVVVEKIVSQIFQHAMASALVNKKKIIKVKHALSAGIEKSPLFCLFSPLQVYQRAANQVAAETAAQELEALMAKIKSECEKEIYKRCPEAKPKRAKKAAGAAAPAPAAPEPTPAPAQPEPAAEAEEGDSHSSFAYYIGNIGTDVISKHPEFEGNRVSAELRAFLSELIEQFIHRVAVLVWLSTEEMGISTISDEVVLHTLQRIMLDCKTYTETLTLQEVDEPDQTALIAARAAAKAAGTKCDRSTVAKCKVLKCVRELKFDDEHFVDLRAQCLERVAAIEATTKSEKPTDTVQVTA
jgi:hypothetical protein